MSQKSLTEKEITSLKSFVLWLSSDAQKKNLSEKLNESKKIKEHVRSIGQVSARKMKEAITI